MSIIQNAVERKKRGISNGEINDETDFKRMKRIESSFYTICILFLSSSMGLFIYANIIVKIILLSVYCTAFAVGMFYYVKTLRVIAAFEKTSVQNYEDLLLYLSAKQEQS